MHLGWRGSCLDSREGFNNRVLVPGSCRDQPRILPLSNSRSGLPDRVLHFPRSRNLRFRSLTRSWVDPSTNVTCQRSASSAPTPFRLRSARPASSGGLSEASVGTVTTRHDASDIGPKARPPSIFEKRNCVVAECRSWPKRTSKPCSWRSGHDADMHDVCSWHSPSKTLLASPRESGEGSGPCRPATFNPKDGTCSPYLIRFHPAPPYHLIGFPKPWPPGASAVARYAILLSLCSGVPTKTADAKLRTIGNAAEGR